MCTSIVEIALAKGMAKGSGASWFAITHSVVAYDHARHALLEDAITIDFVNGDLPPGARAAVELCRCDQLASVSSSPNRPWWCCWRCCPARSARRCSRA